jgi:hypothetical protein
VNLRLQAAQIRLRLIIAPSPEIRESITRLPRLRQNGHRIFLSPFIGLILQSRRFRRSKQHSLSAGSNEQATARIEGQTRSEAKGTQT